MTQLYQQTLDGRQMLWILLDTKRCTPADETLAEILDLTRIQLVHDDLNKFFADWQMCLLRMRSNVPSVEHLESLFRNQLAKSHRFKLQMELYEMSGKRDYNSLFNMVQQHLNREQIKYNRSKLLSSDPHLRKHTATPGMEIEGSGEPDHSSYYCLLYTSPSPRDKRQSRMPSSA